MSPVPRSTVPPRRPAHGASTAIDFLRRDEGGAALLPAAQRVLRMSHDLLGLVPRTLRDVCEVSGFDDDVVTVRVSSAGAAAKLRQTLPRLTAGLAERGWKVSAIRMRVQPRGLAVPATHWQAASGAAIPPSGIAAFDDLQRRLDDSPLRSAVERLLRRRDAARRDDDVRPGPVR